MAISEPGAVATGPTINVEIEKINAILDASRRRLPLWPVATAPGSDTDEACWYQATNMKLLAR